jgi:hypothetical protein
LARTIHVRRAVNQPRTALNLNRGTGFNLAANRSPEPCDKPSWNIHPHQQSIQRRICKQPL